MMYLLDNSGIPENRYVTEPIMPDRIDIQAYKAVDGYRKNVVSNVKDSVVLKFWRTEFDKWNDKQRDEAIAPITNKVGQFLSSKLVRNIFGQPKSRLNLRKAMDEGKIILVNLSKGKIGEDNANMI